MRKLSMMLLVMLTCMAVLASPALADVNATGIRSINTSTVQAGSTFQVTVDMSITGDGNLASPGIQEFLPTDWEMTPVNNDVFSCNEANAEWFYTSGAFAAGDTKTIVYDVTVPSNATAGTYSISGSVSGYENVGGTAEYREATTTGDTDLEVTLGDLHIYEGDDFQSIIQNAPEGSTIYWHAGTYSTAGVVLPDYVHIVGDGSDVVNLVNVVLKDSDGYSYTGTGAVIEGLNFTGSSSYIDLDRINDVTVKDCVFNDRASSVSDSSIIENCTFRCRLKVETGSDGGIIRNNVFENYNDDWVLWLNGAESNNIENLLIENNKFQNLEASTYDSILIYYCSNLEFSNNYLSNIAAPYDTIYVTKSDGIVLKENTFESCVNGDGAVEFGDAEATLYLNNFINCSGYDYEYSVSTVSWNSPSEISYTYMGNTYSSILGNYFDNYDGEDANADGIGDTAYALATGTDNYPLMNAWEGGEIPSDLTILYDGSVELSDVDFDFTASSGESYPISQRTDLGALVETGIDFSASDSYYTAYGSFYLENIEGITDQSWPGSSWGIYVNGEMTSLGLGANTVSDGDVVSFYYAPWDENTFTQNLDDASYLINISINDQTPVEAVRTIDYQTFDIDSQVNSTLVTVTITATEDLDSLYLMETVPSGWIFTSTDNDDALYRESEVAGTYEWIWADEMSAGDTKTVKYIVQFPADEELGEYELDGVVSAYVDDVDIDDINVLGDSTIEITEDWNPWDDVGSDSDEIVSGSELQEAIKCWINKVPCPTTGAEMTSDRLQYVIHLWLIQ